MHNTAPAVKGAEGSDQVKPEQLQVGQVVFGQRFRLQWVWSGVIPAAAYGQGYSFRSGSQPFFRADQDQFNGALAVDQQADLAAQFKREFKQAAGQFG